ncbi:hypothetical protein QYE76_023341 [Lolium multiflorum]|uniref:Uncharacterized protein n=1 Tax=Lolium multiflorum TaxID=4521 RepID=A0AAD8VSP6_LOLMU|nr:hypothetical protein QYE76_023341 [Lolium multiflorum]
MDTHAVFRVFYPKKRGKERWCSAVVFMGEEEDAVSSWKLQVLRLAIRFAIIGICMRPRNAPPFLASPLFFLWLSVIQPHVRFATVLGVRFGLAGSNADGMNSLGRFLKEGSQEQTRSKSVERNFPHRELLRGWWRLILAIDVPGRIILILGLQQLPNWCDK